MSNEAGARLNFKKFKLFDKCIDYLGHFICPEPLKDFRGMIDAVWALEQPIDLTKLQLFVLIFNIFRRFIPIFSRDAAPLHKKFPNNQLQISDGLSHEETAASETLKVKHIEPPGSALLNSRGCCTVDSDACQEQIGCVLLQKQPDEADRPIKYYIWWSSDAEKAYSTTHCEYLAVVWVVLLLWPYLGCRFTVRASHDALKWI